MKHALKFRHVAIAVMFTLVLSPLVTSTSVVAQPNPPQRNRRPGGSILPGRTLLDEFFDNVGYLLTHMTPANLTGNATGVYYYQESQTGTNIPINHHQVDEHGRVNYTTQEILTFFTQMYTGLTRLNTSLDRMWERLASDSVAWPSNWTFAPWKQTLVKEILALVNLNDNNFLYTNLTLQIFVNNIENWYRAPRTTFANATPEEIYAYINRFAVPPGLFHALQLHVLAELPSHSILDLNMTYLVDSVLPDVEAAKLELEAAGRNRLTISYDANVDVRETLAIDEKTVVILWDPDETLMPAVEAGQTRNAFNGNEAFWAVHFLTSNRTYAGETNVSIQWQYNDGQNATAFKSFLREYLSPAFTHWVSRGARIDFHLFQHLLRGSVYFNDTRTVRDGTFKMAQLRINQFDVDRNVNGTTPSNVSLDVWYGEHEWLGLTVWNDTNDNDYQDIAIRGTAPFLYPETNETLYKFRGSDIGSRTYTPVTLNGSELYFGISFNDIEGDLVPWDQPGEEQLLNDTLSPLHESMDQVAFDFKFGVKPGPNNTLAGDMKVDYTISEFQNASGQVDPNLQGLELSLNTLFTAFRYQFGRQVFQENINMVDQGSHAINGSELQTQRRVHAMRFASGDTVQIETKLDDIPYTLYDTVTGTSQTAIGQLIPAKAGVLAVGSTTSAGQQIERISRQRISGGVFIYSTSYPIWDGYTIIHDPTFTTYVTPEGDVGGGLGGVGTFIRNNKWIVIVIGLVAVVVIVGVIAARRKGSSSYFPRGTPPDASTESHLDVVAKEDKGPAGPWHPLNSLFFPSSPGDTGTTLTRVTLDVFDLFTSILSLDVFLYHAASQTWYTVAHTVYDRDRGSQFLPPEPTQSWFETSLYDAGRLALPPGGGRVLLYEGTPGTAGKSVFLVDAYLQVQAGDCVRVVGAFRRPLPETLVERVQVVFQDLAHHFRATRYAPEEIQAPLLEFLHARYPLVLGYPYLVHTGRAQGYLDRILHEFIESEPFTREDLAEISRDLDYFSTALPPDRLSQLVERFIARVTAFRAEGEGEN